MPSDGPLPPGARVVAYYRDSGHADQERSVPQQRRAAEAYCEQHQVVLLRAFADEARPGGSVEQGLELSGHGPASDAPRQGNMQAREVAANTS